jgi:hypothetical protein
MRKTCREDLKYPACVYLGLDIDEQKGKATKYNYINFVSTSFIFVLYTSHLGDSGTEE